MGNVRRRKGGGNGHGTNTGGAGQRRNVGDVLGELCALLEDVVAGTTDRLEARRALARFVSALTDSQQRRIRRGWPSLPLAARERLWGGFFELGSFGGPAEALVHAIHEDTEAWPDALPATAPTAGPQRTAEEWVAIFVRDGFPEEKAKVIAAELTRSDDDRMREFWLENGRSPEEAETLVAKHRAAEKWREASDAIVQERLEAEDRKTEEKLRPLVADVLPWLEKLDEAAREAAWRLQNIESNRRDLNRLRLEAIRAGRHPLELQEMGWRAFGDSLWAVSERATSVAADMRTLANHLARPSGGQADETVRRAARKLIERHFTLRQATEVLAKHGVVPPSYTPEHLRDLLRKPPIADEGDTPGKDPSPSE